MNGTRTEDKARNDLETITEQIEEGVRRGKFTLAEIQEAVVEKTKAAARTTDHYVHENPWSAIGIAAGVGLIIGLLVRRH